MINEYKYKWKRFDNGGTWNVWSINFVINLWNKSVGEYVKLSSLVAKIQNKNGVTLG